MKSYEGYLKQKFGDDYLLLAGGGKYTLSDFLTTSGGTLTGPLTFNINGDYLKTGAGYQFLEGFDNSKYIQLGYQTGINGYNTYISGKSIIFQVGNGTLSSKFSMNSNGEATFANNVIIDSNCKITGYLNFNDHGYLQSGRSSSFNYGYSLQIGDSANSMGMFSGPGGEEGAVIVTPDTCIVYNSSDTGYNFACYDKDRGGDLTTTNSLLFAVRQDTYCWSRGGFIKEGSSDSYVLLGGGGHKAVSDFSTGSVSWANITNKPFTFGDDYIRNGYQYLRLLKSNEGIGITDSNWSTTFLFSNLGSYGTISHNAQSCTMYFKNSYIGINDAGPAYNLEVAGTVGASNYYIRSDRKFKKNISNISKHVRKFQLKENNKTCYGFIAQELYNEVPDLVDINDKCMMVDYNSALSYYIGQLENRVKYLEDQINKNNL